jgi:hypothetical protein
VYLFTLKQLIEVEGGAMFPIQTVVGQDPCLAGDEEVLDCK